MTDMIRMLNKDYDLTVIDEIEGGSDAVKKLTDIMETDEQDMKART